MHNFSICILSSLLNDCQPNKIIKYKPVIESVVGADVVPSDAVASDAMASDAVGKEMVALGLTRVGYSMSKGSDGPKHSSLFCSGKFSQFKTSGH